MNPDTTSHQAVLELLPWYATGQLDAAGHARVQAHLAGCEPCRAELAWQRELHLAAALAEPEDSGTAQAGAALARLLPRLAPAVRPRTTSWHAALAAGLRWLIAVPAVPFTCVLAAALLLAEAPQPVYTTLGAGPEAGGDTAVVFRPATTAREVRRILDHSGATVVRGPTVTGAYLLRVAPDRRGAALARLRHEPAVLLAEPLTGSPAAPGAPR